MGHNQYFYVTDVFGKEAEWSIIGTGAVTSHTFDYHHGITCRMVRTLAGKLRIHASDLVPQHNFEFGLCSAHSFFGVPLNETGGLSSKVFLALRWSTLDMTGFDLEPLTIDELRALRNCIYAMHGYAFRDEELRSYYERFPWYVADPNMTNIASELSPKEQRLIAQIVALERSAK